MNKNKKYAVISLSGGMDSSTLLLRLLSEGYECTAISFDYGQKHNVELERAKDLVNYINTQRLDPATTAAYAIKNSKENMLFEFITEENLDKIGMYPKIKHQVIKLDGLSQLLNSALVTGGEEVPEGHYAEENQRATVVPNRNKIFSSIIQAVALSIAESKNCNVEIAMGIHAGDHSIYPDCRQEFRDIDYEAFKAGNWGAEKVAYYTPYLLGDKFDILKDGEKCCEQLGLDFDAVYRRTNTSYKPIKHVVIYDDGTASEEWFSDFKSASSIERILAFAELRRKDPVQYADEYGPVTWEMAENHALEIDKEFKENHPNF